MLTLKINAPTSTDLTNKETPLQRRHMWLQCSDRKRVAS
jgi:hypothetical protein